MRQVALSRNSSAEGSFQSSERIRAEIAGRLRLRLADIGEEIFLHVHSLSQAAGQDQADYLEGMRSAVAETLDFGLTAIETGEVLSSGIPAAAAAQVRRAAAMGVGLDTVLRRYAAGERLAAEALMDEGDVFGPQVLREALRVQGRQADQLMVVVADEYRRELKRLQPSPIERLRKAVGRVLAGEEPRDVAGLDYAFESWHRALILVGESTGEAGKSIAAQCDCRHLLVPKDEASTWLWISKGSSKDQIALAEFYPKAAPGLSISMGEPRWGLEGWRTTHREALSALTVALCSDQELVRSADVLHIASILRDETTARSLQQTYLSPLDRHNGQNLLETVQAYLAHGYNAATAAGQLGIDRHTVQRRLKRIEELLGTSIEQSHVPLSLALSVRQLSNG